MSKSTITVAGISPALNILGATQQLNFSQNLSTLQINNSYIPTSLVSTQTNSEFRNNLLSGFRWNHLTSNTDTYGTLTLQSFVNASSTGTNLMTFNSSGVGIFAPLNMNSQIISSGTWNGSTITVPYGGTGIASATAYAVLCSGITSTGAFQSVSGVGTSGQVLTSQGASALPIWSAPIVGTATLNGTTAVTITSSVVTTNSIINITRNTGSSALPSSGNVGILSVGNISGTTFQVVSTNASDTYRFTWQIINP